MRIPWMLARRNVPDRKKSKQGINLSIHSTHSTYEKGVMRPAKL
jgi:hypothetical protein